MNAQEMVLQQQARWLQIPKEVTGTGIALYQCRFQAQKGLNCVISAACTGIFELYLNGRRIGVTKEDGEICYDELKPGLLKYPTRQTYWTYDLTEYLKDGENTLLAAVAGGWYFWYYPTDVHYCKFRAAFCVGEEMFYTNAEDGTWKCTIGGPVLEASIYNGETYDARIKSFEQISANEEDGLVWNTPEIDTELNCQLSAATTICGRIRKDLQRNPVKVWTYSQIQDNGTDFGSAVCKEITLPYTLSKGETMVFDMGQNMTGWPYVVMKGTSGTKVHIGCGEMCNDSGSKARNNDGPEFSVYKENYRSALSEVNYYMRGGCEESYRPTFTFYGFQYLDIVADEDVEVVSLVGEVVTGIMKDTGHITTNSADINKLFSNIYWGQIDNYMSVPTDCPQRDERMGWTGDAQVFCRTGAYNGDIKEFMRKYFQDMRDTQGEEGQLANTWPNPKQKYGSAGWADAAIIMPYTIYLMYGDKKVLEENYNCMDRFMGWLSTRNDEGANPEFGDWLAPEPTDPVYIGMCYYAEDARMMSYISSELSSQKGDYYDKKAEHYAEVFKKVKAHFAQRYLDESGYLKKEEGLTSQTAHLLALHFHLVPEDCRPGYIEALKNMIQEKGCLLSTGFIGTYILLPTLSDIGLDNLAYALITQPKYPSWVFCVRQGATTIWERWNSYTLEDGFYIYYMNSLNHYAYGAVGEWMYRYMAGIEADEKEPGFKHFILQPRPDLRTEEEIQMAGERITQVQATFETAYGVIESAWTMTDGVFTYRAVVPEGSSATLHLPFVSEETTRIISGAPVGVKEGVYELSAGCYEFKNSTCHH